MTHATNATVMRASNRKLILNMIRLGPVSRAELAERARLTRASITQIVDELLEAGLVEPCPDAAGTAETGASADVGGAPGRRRTLLTLRRRARFVFGVHISRRRCRVGVVDLCGDVLAQSELPLAGHTPESAADAIAGIIRAQMEQLRLPAGTIWGIGVSTPGPVEHREGMILNPPNFDAWHNTPICAMLRARTGLPALLEKDTNARALEEKYFGAAADISGFMLVQIDEGVGSGVVIHNELYRGTRGLGTEIGHTTIRYDGPPCRCGGHGCLENYLRIPALLTGSRFSDWDQLTACAGDPDAARLLDTAAEYLAAALVNAINLYDLEKVILSGDILSRPQPLLDRLNPLVRARALSRSSLQPVPVSASAGVLPVRTAAMAALYDVFQERN